MRPQTIYPFAFQLTSKSSQNSSPLKTRIGFLNENKLASFKDQISNVNWGSINSTQYSLNSLYEVFLNIFKEIYDANYPLTETEINPKNLITSWLGNRLKNTSKTKQKLYGDMHAYIYINAHAHTCMDIYIDR